MAKPAWIYADVKGWQIADIDDTKVVDDTECIDVSAEAVSFFVKLFGAVTIVKTAFYMVFVDCKIRKTISNTVILAKRLSSTVVLKRRRR
jgi:hypothetical protein